MLIYAALIVMSKLRWFSLSFLSAVDVIYEPVRVSHDRLQSDALNRGRQILLNLRYTIEATILRILAQAISKNIYPLIFYKHFTKSPKRHLIYQRRS